MKLSENPFALLGATPRDNRRQLAEKADEASLLNGAAGDEALAVLMQMNKRIPAELGWFPGADGEKAEAFARYAEAAAEGKAGPLPSLEGLGTPLAQANALAAVFEAWPDGKPDYLIGLCRSLDLILSKVTVEETLAAVNADRQAGGWETVADETAFAGLLEDRLRELAAPILTRMEHMVTDSQVTEMMNTLFSFKYPDFDSQGTVAQTMADGYLMRVHDREEAARKTIREKLDTYIKTAPTITALNGLKEELEAWCAMTASMRKVPGKMRREAQGLCHDMRECIVNYVNHAPTTSKQQIKTVPTPGGHKIITLTYQSKMDALDNGIGLSQWLINSFPEQEEQIDRLKTDIDTLQHMIMKENSEVTRSLMNAR